MRATHSMNFGPRCARALLFFSLSPPRHFHIYTTDYTDNILLAWVYLEKNARIYICFEPINVESFIELKTAIAAC